MSFKPPRNKELHDKVAEAMWNRTNQARPFSERSDGAREPYLRMADAAIAAMQSDDGKTESIHHGVDGEGERLYALRNELKCWLAQFSEWESEDFTIDPEIRARVVRLREMLGSTSPEFSPDG